MNIRTVNDIKAADFNFASQNKSIQPIATLRLISSLTVTGGYVMELTWTAWNNGTHLTSGAGYGLKIPIIDRDMYFKHNWSKIILELPNPHGYTEVEVNISKSSFWSKACHEIICKDIGIWLRGIGLAPWPSRNPPKLQIQIVGEKRFRVKRSTS